MDVQALAIFVQAQAAGSIAEAARRLRITSLTGARRLAALEEELGVRLLQRTTRSLSLTPEGEAFLPHAMALLEADLAARESVRGAAEGVTGLLRVTTSAAFGRQVLTPLLASFMADHPDVRVDLIMTDAVLDLVAERIDLAVRVGNPGESSLLSSRVAENPRGLYAAPSYLAGRKAPARLADLAFHDCLALTGRARWTFRAGGLAKHVLVEGRVTASSIDGLSAACVAGMGIGLFSHWAVREDLEAGRLLPVPLVDAEAEPLDIWVLHPSRRLTPVKVRRLIAYLRDRVQPQPYKPSIG